MVCASRVRVYLVAEPQCMHRVRTVPATPPPKIRLGTGGGGGGGRRVQRRQTAPSPLTQDGEGYNWLPDPCHTLSSQQHAMDNRAA